MSLSYDFMVVYGKVRPIVLKVRGTYTIKLWESDDWDQEGMIALYELLSKEPELSGDIGRLCVCFKTKFTNRVKDALRKQESRKRQFDKMVYEEIGEVAHRVISKGFEVSEQVAYNEMMSAVDKTLTDEEREQLTYVMAGKCFRGKRAFQRRMRTRLGQLGWGPDVRWLEL